MSTPRLTLADVLREVVRHPVRHLVINWNWKAALLSAICSASLFLAVNLPAGVADEMFRVYDEARRAHLAAMTEAATMDEEAQR